MTGPTPAGSSPAFPGAGSSPISPAAGCSPGLPAAGLSPTSPAAAGGDVIVLSTGDVRIPVYPDAGGAGPRRGDQAYLPPAGTGSLREAVSAYMTGTGRAVVRPEEVLVAPGARLAILCVLSAVLRPSDQVLLPSPYWASYPTLIAAAGGRPVIAPGGAGDGFPDLAALEASRSRATRVVVINSPRNPDGSVLAAERLRELADWTAAQGMILLFDQVYRGVPHGGGYPPSVLDLWPQLPGHCVVVDGLSKSHALAGLRLGWALAAPPVLDAAVSHASHVIGGTCSAAQDTALAAIRGTAALRDHLGPALDANRRAAAGQLAGIPGVSCAPPRGGIFAFPDLRDWLANWAPEPARQDLTGWLRGQHGVSVVDGAAFGAPGHIRLSFALPADDLEAGLRRLRRALVAHTPPPAGGEST